MSRPTAAEQKTSAGFSLVEVMCALAITAMALVVLFRGLGGSRLAASYLEAHLGARVVAQSILEDELHATGASAFKRAGDTGMYHWTLSSEPVAIDAVSKLPVPFRLYRLSVRINWEPRGSFLLDTLKVGK